MAPARLRHPALVAAGAAKSFVFVISFVFFSFVIAFVLVFFVACVIAFVVLIQGVPKKVYNKQL